jgi:flagellar basal body-associated protein FliL
MSIKKPEETAPMKSSKKTDETRPSATVKTVKSDIESAEEIKTIKPKRGRWVFLGIICLLVIVGLGCLTGYGLAIKARQAAETERKLTTATMQYVLAMEDIASNNLSMAKTRLEYVIQIYPDYPEAAAKLTEVMVTLAQSEQAPQTTQAVATVAPVVDTRKVEAIYQTAEQQLATAMSTSAMEDWLNLLNTVNSIRNADPTYRSIKVDGMYFLALRNAAINSINSGHLETGIYYLTLASQIGPVDSDALGYRNRAIMYLNASAGFGVTWQRAVTGFETLYGMVPYMIDVNGVTVTKRYAEALAGYGDYLQSTNDWCGAVEQYEKSMGIWSLESVTSTIDQAREYCANPPVTETATPEP